MLKRDEKLPAIKLTIVQCAIVGVLLVLLFGLWRLQVVGAENYRTLAEQNRIRKVPMLAPRGKLFDREGRLIVDNYPSVSCFLIREQGHDVNADLPMIANGLHMTVEQLQAILKKYRAAPKYQPLPLKQDITPDEQEFIEAHRDEFTELETVDEERRLYPRDGFAAHLIGYVGEVSEDMLNSGDPRYAYYEPGDVVGRSGIEESYDALLRGKDGSRDVIVDSHGREVGKLGSEPAQAGQSLRLTIDLDIQRAAENALGERNGAIIALDPHTGEILAMVSRPAFDPNQFAVRIGRDEWSRLLADPHHPLLNKAIQAQLAPGSTFKIIMSTAGLGEGIAQDMKVNCAGGATFYGHFFACDHHHGVVDIQHAIPWSCDTFYYTLAQRLGIDTIAKYAHALGIGRKTGIDLPDETTGIMPSTQWKMKTFHEKWYAGETISVGIGQGAVAVTPIQLLRAISGVASGGALKRPHLVFPDQIPANYKQAVLESFPGSDDANVAIAPESWQTITDGMFEAVNGGGYSTAAASRLDGIDFAGKTGTAQVVGCGDTHVKGGARTPNSWFVGMVPRRNPEIAVVVLQEHGDWGSLSAKIAQAIVTTYVNKKRLQDHNLLQQASTSKPVEVGAVWSGPAAPDSKQHVQNDALHAGHYFIDIPQPSKALASKQTSLPGLIAALPLRWRERLP